MTWEMPDKAPTLEEYRSMMTVHECQWCGEDISDQPIEAYSHEYGWLVHGYYSFGEHKRQWLSINCPGCNYDWSLNKLGVNRK